MAAKESKPAEAEAPSTAEAAAPAAAGKGGGIKGWLPLITNILLMPVVAYAVTKFVLLPKLHVQARTTTETAEPHADSRGAEKAGPAGKVKYTVPLSGKVLVNLAGTMGSRYLLANLTLVSTNPELEEAVKKGDAELRDAAASALSSKTIADLEKPGARNVIRSELMTVFNNVLGSGMVTEIYLTEFAIQ